MTDDEIDSMPAGPEMDRLVAERVMEWEEKPGPLFPITDDLHVFLPPPTAFYGTIRVEFRCRLLGHQGSVRLFADSEGPLACGHCGQPFSTDRCQPSSPPPYSTDDAAALEVLEHLANPHTVTTITMTPSWFTVSHRDQDRISEGWANDSLALAICRAALKTTTKEKV